MADRAGEFRVFKYPLALKSGPQVIDMPHGAEIIHVHEQNDVPTLWAAVTITAPPTPQTFHVIATGHEPVPPQAWHEGTVHIGWTVWHVYREVSHG